MHGLVLFQEEGWICVEVLPEVTCKKPGLEVRQQAEGNRFLKKGVDDFGLLALLPVLQNGLP